MAKNDSNKIIFAVFVGLIGFLISKQFFPTFQSVIVGLICGVVVYFQKKV